MCGKPWPALGNGPKKGSRFSFGDGLLRCEVVDVLPDGNRLIHFEYNGVFFHILDQIGQMPLPPYIKARLEDKERYQTVYSREEGSAAAPTAGLHFTPELLEKIKNKGVELGFVTLHVGLGTFRPVSVEDIQDHKMHSEHYYMPQSTADLINRTKERGGRVIAVGTTSCRTIESVAQREGCFKERRRLDRYLPLSRLCIPWGRRPHHQFSPAGKHPHHAGLRSGRPGKHPACLPCGCAGAV